jgi:hypothetical protein
MKTFDIANRELDHLRKQFADLYVRTLADREGHKLDERCCEFEQLMAAIRQWQAALGLPQPADAD